MRKIIFLALSCFAVAAFAQSDLDSMLRSAKQVQDQSKYEEDARRRQAIAEQKERERVRAEQERIAQERAFEVEKKRIDAAQAAERDRMALVRERQAREEKENLATELSKTSNVAWI